MRMDRQTLSTVQGELVAELFAVTRSRMTDRPSQRLDTVKKLLSYLCPHLG